METIILLEKQNGNYFNKVLLSSNKQKMIHFLLREESIMEGLIQEYLPKEKPKRNKTDQRLEKILNQHDELKLMYNYFSKYKSRNAYYIIMRQEAVKRIELICRRENIHLSLTDQAIISGLNNHASIIHIKNLNNGILHPEHEIVAEIMWDMINQNKYPIVVRNNGVKTLYKWQVLEK